MFAGLVYAEPETEPVSKQPNVVIQWNNAALQGVRDSKLGPPMVARALAIIHTCIYDAWTAYDGRALETQLRGSLRRHQPPHGQRHKVAMEESISYAAYRAAVDLFPGDREQVFNPLMQALGYDPANTTTDTTEPAGIGNVACAAVLEYRTETVPTNSVTRPLAVFLTAITRTMFRRTRLQPSPCTLRL